ncbi:uncharacterized protein DS421_15g503730 [Arachis hypogaea]|nr:uncharacterized protein DS421_15g503730 [Arachis hypogaea]
MTSRRRTSKRERQCAKMRERGSRSCHRRRTQSPSTLRELVAVTSDNLAAAMMGGRGGYVNTTANCSLALPLLIRFKAIAAAAVAEDDAFLVKQIGQSFRYSKIQARREEQIQAAHDEAIFGASALPPPTSTDSEPERENEKEVDKKAVVTSLLSETVSGFTADLCG